jgi:hypothetical protein
MGRGPLDALLWALSLTINFHGHDCWRVCEVGVRSMVVLCGVIQVRRVGRRCRSPKWRLRTSRRKRGCREAIARWRAAD